MKMYSVESDFTNLVEEPKNDRVSETPVKVSSLRKGEYFKITVQDWVNIAKGMSVYLAEAGAHLKRNELLVECIGPDSNGGLSLQVVRGCNLENQIISVPLDL